MPTGSVTQWLLDLKDGNEQSAQLLWERYFDRLTLIAKKRIGSVTRLGTDGEDVALSAFHSLCAGVGEGRFADLADRESLWKLLVTIAVRKAQRAIRDEFTQKRGGGFVIGESSMMSAEEVSAGVHVLEKVLGNEPTPEFAAQVAEEWQGLLNSLGDDELRRIAIWKMEGCTSNEIAKRLGKSLATIERRLKLIRMAWTETST